MSIMKKKTFPLFLFIVLLFCSLGYFVFTKVTTQVLVARVESASIRDSVTGNVKVHASATFDLKSEASAMVDWVALLPLGQTLPVEQNQTLVQLVKDDLDRQMDRLLLDKEQHDERKKEGSPTEILLKIKEKELTSIKELLKHEKVSTHELEVLQNEVDRLDTQVRLEKLSHQHFLENHDLSLSNLKAQIAKRSIVSPIQGDFSSCFVAPGNHVFAGSVVGKVHSKDRIVEVSLNEDEFQGIQSGLKAGVSFFSHPNQIFDAEVSALSATVDTHSGIRKLFLTLSDQSVFIPVGSSGRAEIIKSEKTEALIIPRKALVGDFVVLEQGGVAHFRKVKTGSKNLLTIEVIEGLRIGDRVVVETPHLIKEGQRISPTVITSQK
jgi:RND family efflux transporter MFP subunit